MQGPRAAEAAKHVGMKENLGGIMWDVDAGDGGWGGTGTGEGSSMIQPDRGGPLDKYMPPDSGGEAVAGQP